MGIQRGVYRISLLAFTHAEALKHTELHNIYHLQPSDNALRILQWSYISFRFHLNQIYHAGMDFIYIIWGMGKRYSSLHVVQFEYRKAPYIICRIANVS